MYNHFPLFFMKFKNIIDFVETLSTKFRLREMIKSLKLKYK